MVQQAKALAAKSNILSLILREPTPANSSLASTYTMAQAHAHTIDTCIYFIF